MSPEVLAASTFPAALDPVVGPEVPVAPAVTEVYSPSYGTQTGPASIATNGSEYLVVWNDLRAGNPGHPWATRVRPDGTVLDPAGFRLLTGAGPNAPPAVASNGTDFLVVWTGGMAHVGSNGAVLATGALPIGTNPSIAFDGAHYVVASAPTPAAAGVTLLRVDTTGHAVDPAPIVVAATGSEVSVAASVSGYLVTWWDSTAVDIRYARLTPAGVLLDTTPQPVTVVGASRSWPVVASDGTNYYIAWNSAVASGSRGAGVYGTLLSPAGATLGPLATYFGAWNATSGTYENRPGVAFDGTWFDVTMTQRSALAAARVDRTGALVDTTPRLSPTLPFGPGAGSSVAGAPGIGFAATNLTDVEVYTADGTPSATLGQASLEGDAQTMARAASVGNAFAVTWFDKNYSNLGGARAARIAPGFTVLDAPAIVLDTLAWMPGITSNGTGYLLSWSPWTGGAASGYSMSAPLSTAGALDASTATTIQGVVAAYGGGISVAATSTGVSRVGPTGAMLDAAPIVLPGSSPAPFTLPVVTFNGTNFLIA